MKIENKIRFIRDVDYFGIDRIVGEKHIETLKTHISYVLEAGHKISVLESLLDIHDDSRWFEAEFVGYALHFQGGGAPDQFSRAWLHHIHHNPHHWQHWLFSDGYTYTPKGSQVESGAIEMPHCFALEMVADWMGAAKTYTGSWDMAEGLAGNIPKIRLHSKTTEYLRETLDHLGYSDIVYTRSFAK